MPGLFVGGTQFPQDGSPIVTMPIVHFASSQFSSNYVTGYYALDANTGRGVGSLTVQGFPLSPLAFYIVRPDRRVGAADGHAVRQLGPLLAGHGIGQPRFKR